jgi:ABC-type transporter lipoprotein component MlaA
MNPMTQLFSLALIQIYQRSSLSINKYNNTIEQLKKQFGDDIENFNKQKDKYCAKEIEKLIFEPILIKVKNKINGQSDILKFFK